MAQDTGSGVVVRLLAGAAVVGLLLAACAGGTWWVASAAFTRLAVTGTLEDQVARIEATSLPERDKAELRYRIEDLIDKVHEGTVVIGFADFVSQDLVLDEALEDGAVTDEELAAMHEAITELGM